MDEIQQEVFLKFWRNQKSKIHDILVDKSNWNNHLNKMTWRIDSKAKSRTQNELNELSAIVELNLQNENNTKVVRFEMDKTQLDRTLDQIKNIQKQLTKYSS